MWHREKRTSLPPKTVGRGRARGIAWILVGLVSCLGGSAQPGPAQLTTPTNAGGFFQVPVASKKPPAVAPVAGPDPAHKALLLQDIEQALLLLKDDKLEQFIEDYYPIEMMKGLRRLDGLTKTANDLRRTKSVLKRFESKLTKCRTAVIEGNNNNVVFMPVEEAAEEPLPVAVAPATTAPLKGYPGELKQALPLAITDLKAKQYEVFIQQMLPVSEVNRLTSSELLAETALLFEEHPTLAPAMIADLDALAKLPLKAEGNLIQATVPPRDKNDVQREVRFQKVGGSWRFYDQTTEAQALIDQLAAQADKMASNPAAFEPILKFERIREHWRLVELP